MPTNHHSDPSKANSPVNLQLLAYHDNTKFSTIDFDVSLSFLALDQVYIQVYIPLISRMPVGIRRW